MKIEKHIKNSHPLKFQDLDWELAAEAGLTEGEKICLEYIADVEGQTIFYMREMLGTSIVEDSDAVTFMTIWNYEEFFHGYATQRFLEVCGVELGHERRREVRGGAQFAAKAEAAVQWVLARIMPSTFKALYFAWAASQEFLTKLAYEEIAATTKNPVLKTLCLRIAKQERRHFAWYFNSARHALAESSFSQRIVRFIFEKFWTPVGVGVKSKSEARELITNLFPGPLFRERMNSLDTKISQLPGLADSHFAGQYAAALLPDRDQHDVADPRILPSSLHSHMQ